MWDDPLNPFDFESGEFIGMKRRARALVLALEEYKLRKLLGGVKDIGKMREKKNENARVWDKDRVYTWNFLSSGFFSLSLSLSLSPERADVPDVALLYNLFLSILFRDSKRRRRRRRRIIRATMLLHWCKSVSRARRTTLYM